MDINLKQQVKAAAFGAEMEIDGKNLLKEENQGWASPSITNWWKTKTGPQGYQIEIYGDNLKTTRCVHNLSHY